MHENIRVIRIFIGSPGGLDEERKTAHAVVKEVNQLNSDHWGLMFKLMGWEEAIPGYQRAQDKINEDLDRCDYFLGVMWDKWGSKPSNEPGGYTSGFEEEYYRSAQRIDAGLMKDMALYFKKIEVPPGMEPGPEIKKVLGFRRKCIDEHRVFFRDFSDVDTFAAATRAKMMEIGWKEFTDRAISEHDQQEEDQPPQKEIESERSSDDTCGLIDEDAKYFLSDILDRSADWDLTEPHEIARLRLIASSVARSGNDDIHLGTHDANLVFRHYRNSVLSDQELTALIDCGVAGFKHQNVPLWCWISKADLGPHYLYRLRTLATLGSSNEQVGAIKILQELDSPLPTHDGYFNKSGVLTDWLSDSTEASVLDAVVSFLATNGSEEDIPLIEDASQELPPYKKSKVETAIVEMVSRRSAEDALTRICDRYVASVGNELASKLLANPQSLTTDTLRSCLAAKPDSIRAGAARILYERREIEEETADILLTDDNVEIRLVAAEVLYNCGRNLDDDVVEKALKVQKTGGRGVFGFAKSETDTTQLDIYRANRRAEYSALELANLADEDFVEYRCLMTLFDEHGKKAQLRIRQGLQDGFAAYLESSTASFREKHAANAKSLELLEHVLPIYKKELCNSATQALSRLKNPEDLEVIRQCVDTLELEADTDIFRYISRYGDWQDVQRILKLGLDENTTRNILSIPTVSLAKERATALLSVGKDRVADLLVLELDARIRTAMLKQLPKSSFVGLTDDLVLSELSHPNAEHRAIVALRCVQDLPKARVTALLKRYIDAKEYRFYNSIHWLDLGVSLPKKLSRSIAVKELARR